MAAMTRTSTLIGRAEPTRSNSRSWSTRRSASWVSGGRSPTSSRKMVPPSASSKRPARRSSAPVKAPFSCPNSSEAINVGGMAAQFTLTNARDARCERLWIARATSSFPVPVSPVMSTVESVGATCATLVSTARSAGEVPTISSNIDDLSTSSRSARFSSRIRCSARLRSSMSVPVENQPMTRPSA